MHTFHAYKESDLLKLPFMSVIDLYNRALEIENGEILPDPEIKSETIIETTIDNQLRYNHKTKRYE